VSHFKWTENMSVGSEIVDSDHRALIGLINKVADIADAIGEETVADVLDGLIAYVEFHFAREEKMMAAAGFAGVEAHGAEHAGFTDHVYQLRREFEIDETSVDAGALSDYLKNWLNHHIMIQDMAYKGDFAGNPEVEEVGRAFGEGLSEREP